MIRFASRMFGLLVILSLFFGALPLRSAASSPPERGDGTLVYSDPLQIGERPLQGKPLHPEGFLRLDPSIAAVPEDFIITFTGDWSAEAKAAFNYAASIWSALIDPKVKISIEADPGSTGGPAVAAVYSNIIDNLPRENTLYPRALANHLLGYDVHPDQVDFKIFYNPSFEWYYGTDGNTPWNQVDFVSVVLHEIGHGLGFISSFGLIEDYSLDQYRAYWGSMNNWPYLYDTMIENGAGQSLTDTSLFPNSSTALAVPILADDVYFDAPLTRANNQAQTARLNGGLHPICSNCISLEHLNEAFYENTAHKLMTPSIRYGEVLHHPGSMVLGMLADMGWTLASNLPQLAPLPAQMLPANTQRLNAIDLWAFVPPQQSPGTAFTYTILNTPAAQAGISLHDNRYIDILPASGWMGRTRVSVQATNLAGLSAVQTFEVIVVEQVYASWLPMTSR